MKNDVKQSKKHAKQNRKKEGPGPKRDVAAGAGEHYKIKDRR